MKHISWFTVVMLFALCIAGCAAPTNVIPAEYTSLIQLCDTIAMPGQYWNSEAPGVEYKRMHVEVTEELQSKAYKILTEHKPILQPDMRDNGSRDRTGGAIVFNIYASEDGMNPIGEQLAFATVIPLGKNDPIAPNTTSLALGAGGDCYTYPAEVYDELLTLFKANTVKTYAELEGEYVRLTPLKNDMYLYAGDIIECGGILLRASYAHDGGSVKWQNWQLEAFDLAAGKSLYTLESAAVPEDRGALLRLTNVKDVPDYDYAVYYQNGIAYRNSADAAKELWNPLPADVAPLWDASVSNTAYDEYGESIAWTAADGIYLRGSKQDSTARNLILPNTGVAELVADGSGVLSYFAPRFICGGQKIAAAVYKEDEFQDIAVVIYDIGEGKISGIHSYGPSFSAKYPIADRYVAVCNYSPINLFDAATGEVTELPQMRIAKSYDYKTFIISDYTSLDANNAPAYICDIGNLADRSRPLLRSGEPQAQVSLMAVTENRAIFNVSDFDGDWLAVARY